MLRAFPILLLTLLQAEAQDLLKSEQVVSGSVQSTSVTLERFEFESFGDRLEGTLWLPSSGGAFPAIVCVHGSGKIDRNDSYIRAVAERYSSRGIAVLTFDKRGVGKSGGQYPGSTGGAMAMYASDGLAALKALEARDDIDETRTGLFGVSQAGYIIPIAAAMAKSAIDFTIIVSGPVVSIAQENLYSDLTGDSQGAPTRHSMESILEKVELRGSAGYDPYSFVEEMPNPGLWIYGDRDKSVPVGLSVANLEAIRDQWKRHFTVEVIENADHGIKKSTTGNRWEVSANAATAAGYFEIMDAWLRRIGILTSGQ